MKTGCSKHSVTHGESFSFLRIFNQSRQNRANKAWGVCFGGRGFSLAPVLLQFCVRWDKPTTPLDFRLYSLLNNKCFLPPLPCRGLRGSGKSSQLPFPTSDPTGNFLPSLTSAFHSPGPGGTRCHCLVTEEAQWCKPDHPISSFDTPMASQPPKSQVISTASLLSSFLSEYMLLKSPANEKMLISTWQNPTRSWLPSTLLSAVLRGGTEWATLHHEVIFPTQIYLSDLPISSLFLQPEDQQQPMTNAV